LLAEELGEFARENIAIEFVTAPPADLLPMLGSGAVDVISASLSAATMNAVSSGVEIKAVAPLYYKSGGKDGLWIAERHKDCAPACLKGGKIASAAGPGTGTLLPMAKYLETGGVDITDVEVVTFATADAPLALESGAVDAAWLLSPAYKGVEEDGVAKFVQSQFPGQGGFYWFGPSLLDKNREAGLAFVRAIARTNRHYLQGNYKADDDTVKALAAAEGVPEKAAGAGESYVFSPDLEFDVNVFQPLQKEWMKFGDTVVDYDEPLTAADVVDGSFIEEATGWTP